MKSGRKTFDELIVAALLRIVNNHTVDKKFVNGVILEKRAFCVWAHELRISSS
jgi:hypothetical protein